MAIWFNQGGVDREIGDDDIRQCVESLITALPGNAQKILLVPPDFSRFHSGAGEICVELYNKLTTGAEVHVLPALGTHRPMTADEMNTMFPGIPHNVIKVHDWQHGLTLMGEIPGSRLSELSNGKVDYKVQVEIDRIAAEGGYDSIISIGQVVPHEVVGMANGNKNILVGIGGPDIINKSHFLGAVCNMESLMGRVNSPVRELFNEAEDRFLQHLPLNYILTVRAKNSGGKLVTRGLFAGNTRDCYVRAAELSREVNIIRVLPLSKIVVYLDPGEFKSTWIGNKAIYRTRMAIADNGELLIIAPGLVEFGEAEINERMIIKYGYHGTPATLKHVKNDPELRASLGAAAHLIHGSSEDRFSITYAPGGLDRAAIESVGFKYTGIEAAMRRYDPGQMKDGFNTMPDGERIYYISNPALGLWQME